MKVSAAAAAAAALLPWVSRAPVSPTPHSSGPPPDCSPPQAGPTLAVTHSRGRDSWSDPSLLCPPQTHVAPRESQVSPNWQLATLTLGVARVKVVPRPPGCLPRVASSLGSCVGLSCLSSPAFEVKTLATSAEVPVLASPRLCSFTFKSLVRRTERWDARVFVLQYVVTFPISLLALWVCEGEIKPVVFP
ncbi:hypothetical protein GWK47_014497 [Chionoecetes opilio]|uniref:Secreted protein n=1 Tax=Chionoecetes opilio TaxID=41210 RepID=A0A8J5CNC9_CHIOP|nr:hypothetical protein GWK47_014497 [Chionoecetes opilio]